MTARRKRGPIDVAIVERRRLVRAALVAVLETVAGIRVVAAAERWDGAVPACDVVVLGAAGDAEIDAALAAHAGGRPRVIVLAGAAHERLAPRAAAAGASGFVRTTEPPETLLKAIERVHSGEVWFDGATMAALIASVAGIQPAEPLATAEAAVAALAGRDRDVAAAVVEGLTNREIAARCGITEPAVRHALTRIFRLAGVGGRVELARLGLSLGLGAPRQG